MAGPGLVSSREGPGPQPGLGQPAGSPPCTRTAARPGAVDGGENLWRNDSCTHTDPDLGWPWWAVDLGRQVYVEKVVLVNRGGCCGQESLCDRYLCYDVQ